MIVSGEIFSKFTSPASRHSAIMRKALSKPCLSLFFLLAVLSAAANGNKRDSTKVKDLLDRAKERWTAGRLDSAEILYKEAGTLARSIGYDEGFMEYTGRYAGLLYLQLRFEEALIISREQLAVAKRTGDKRKEANAYNNIALQYLELGRLNTAAENLIAALQIAEQIDDPYNRQKFYSNLSSLFHDLKDKEKSLHYARKGYALAREMNDSVQMGRSLVNLAVSEVLNELYDSALLHSRQTVLLRHLLDNETVMSAYINLGEIFNHLGKYQDALVSYRKARGLINEETSPDYAVHVTTGLAATFQHLGDLKEAERCFDQVRPHAEKYLAGMELIEFYQLGTSLKSASGRPEEALELLRKYTELNDSLVSHNTKMAVQELEIRYQTSVKEKTLAEQQLQISQQQNQLQRKNTFIGLSAGVIVVLLLAATAGYIIRKQRRKATLSKRDSALLQARLEGEEQERTRTARELHDGVGSTLSAAKMHLYTLQAGIDQRSAPICEKAVDLVENAIHEIRSLSHNLAPEILLREGLEYAVKSYCARVSHDNLDIQVYVVGGMPDIPKESQLLLYRIIQEAVNNIQKHSGATQALVQLGFEDGNLSLVIEDNGKGFDTTRLTSRGIGLHNLLARIRLLNGDYQIESSPGNGTALSLTLAISNESKSGNQVT